MVQDVEKRNKSYNQYVENVTKKAGCVYNCFKAFITGGIICTIGQLIMNFMKMTGMTADDAASYTTLILVALQALEYIRLSRLLEELVHLFRLQDLRTV